MSKIRSLSPISLQPSKKPLNSIINMGFIREGVELSNVIVKSSQA